MHISAGSRLCPEIISLHCVMKLVTRDLIFGVIGELSENVKKEFPVELPLLSNVYGISTPMS